MSHEDVQPKKVTAPQVESDAGMMAIDSDSARPAAGPEGGKLEKSLKKRANIEFQDLCFEVKKAKGKDGEKLQILKSVTGAFLAGRVSAVMGPSGSGKTTLMDVVFGHSHGGVTSGRLLLNGKPSTPKAINAVSCYVMQSDVLSATLTVWECILFSSMLRLPRSMPDAERRQRVAAIIQDLGLEECQNTRVGDDLLQIRGISGGQKRRASIGMELVTDPQVVLLDEPTSGLDSEIAQSIMQALHILAAKGCTVACTIHQPNSDIVSMFDDFMLMCRGNLVYGGPWEESMAFFTKHGFPVPQFKNPADFYLSVIKEEKNTAVLVEALKSEQASLLALSKRKSLDGGMEGYSPHESTDAVAGLSPNSDSLEKMELEMKGPQRYTTPFWHQVNVLSWRFALQWMRNPTMLVAEAIQYTFLSIFCGLLYFQVDDNLPDGLRDRGAGIWFVVVCLAFTPSFTTCTTWNAERTLLRRETSVNAYHALAFFIAKTLVMMPVELVFALLTACITYFMMGLQSDTGKFFMYFLILYVLLLVSESYGLLFALVTKESTMAVIYLTLVFILYLSVTGFLTTSIPSYLVWLSKISFVRYGTSALYRNELRGLKVTDSMTGEELSGDDLLADDEGSEQLVTGLTVWEDVAVLLAMLVLLRTLAGVALMLSKKWRRL